MHTTAHIRSLFLDYFKGHNHEVVPSSPLVPHNDPTLMFTNAGMVQFKDVFTGFETRPYKRATSAQKCVRAGGKHNDLENVGHTARHHTFFEMLGNFSFGDYFKEQSIVYAWNLLVKELGLSPDKLVITVYAEDNDAANLWKKISGFSDSKIIRIPTADNFWSMGDTGPCGPCSEIFYDHGPSIPGGLPGTPEEDGDRFVEIWNMVFMQYDRQSDGALNPLPAQSVDTGMGIERIAAVLQGVHNNYETDILKTLVESSAALSKTGLKGDHLISHRVIADHLRSSSFLVADGVLPSNEGRGYVLRRIMRRAMRHVHMLGAKDPLMWQLVQNLCDLMGTAYPELTRAQPLIEEMLKQEEEKFQQTLSRGMKLLEEETEKLSESKILPGDVAFKLYDTYGFPLDLTQDALRSQSIGVDVKGFDAAMEKQKQDARAAWVGSGESKEDKIWYDMYEKSGATEFTGYHTEEGQGLITHIIQQGKEVDALQTGEQASLILNQTPFYAESGGQMGDTGIITTSNGATFLVQNTIKACGALHVHVGTLQSGMLKKETEVHCSVDAKRRRRLKANHSATHLLHKALRDILGTHVTQKGSLVSPDKLRFDFSHPTPLSQKEILLIENTVNRSIRRNASTMTQLMNPEEGIKAGALALFGEKYGDEVRVVTMGTQGDDLLHSVELCGGTHVDRAGEIGFFKITSESSVSSGVRRLEAITGQAAQDYVEEYMKTIDDLALLLKAKPTAITDKIHSLLDDRKKLNQQIKEIKKSGNPIDSSNKQIEEVNGCKVLFEVHQDLPARDLRSQVDTGKKEIKSGVVVIFTKDGGKVGVAIGVTSDLTSDINAVDLVQVASIALGGKGGGGRPDMAQAGGPDEDKIDQAKEAIIKKI